jgi:hypothetical protein
MLSTISPVRAGPTTTSGFGANVVTQRVVIASLRVREVVAVEMGEQSGSELVGGEAGGGETHQHASTGVDEERLAAAADHGRRPGPCRVGY